jgi:hypothetical protein
MLLLLLWVISPMASYAATFAVTEQSCGGGAGTLSQAVRDANGSPGADVIEITPGLVIDGNCDMGTLPADSGLFILETVTIRGQGSTLNGSNYYINNRTGAVNQLNTNGACPSQKTGYTIGGASRSLFEVGQSSVNNSGIELTVEDLSIKQFSQVSVVRDGAKLTLRNVEAIDIRDVERCKRPVVDAVGDADVTLEDVTIAKSTDFQDIFPGAAVAGQDGKLEVYDSEFSLNEDRYALSWRNGDVDIVSSRFLDAGGVLADGNGTWRIINTLFTPAATSLNRKYQDGFLVGSGGTLRLEASTVVYHVNNCRTFPASLDCNSNGGAVSYAAFIADDAQIELVQSAIHVQTIGPIFNPDRTPLLEELGSGDISADDLTFIQPVDWQDAAALEAITNPPSGSLVSGPDALPVTSTALGLDAFSYPDSVTPIITGAAVLRDRVADAGAGGSNELLDPRGAAITKDVLGAPRTDGNLRNIGAVQNDLVPSLIALIEPDAPFTALLFWNQPNASGITGYDLCQGTGAAPALERTTDVCPGTLTEPYTSSAGTTLGVVLNLPPNNVNHWFAVRAVAGSNKEPWSNVRNVVVPLTITYPPNTVVGPTTNIMPTVSGPASGLSFLLLSGTLPAGLSLNPTTGAIAGTLSGSCVPQTLQVLVASSGGALSTAPATISCPVLPVPALQPLHLVLMIMALAFLGRLAVRRRRGGSL